MNWHDPFNRVKKPRFNPRKGKKWPMVTRQEMVLHLYNAGLNTDEVAEIMMVTVPTLYKQLDRIYYKFGVHTREDAIKKGIMK